MEEKKGRNERWGEGVKGKQAVGERKGEKRSVSVRQRRQVAQMPSWCQFQPPIANLLVPAATATAIAFMQITPALLSDGSPASPPCLKH